MSRLRTWWNGWGTALRMARREIGQDRASIAFVWCMIALPVAVICAVQVVVASNDLSERERLGLQLADGQAALNFVGFDGGREFDGVGTLRVWDDGEGRPAARLAGWSESPAEQEDAVAAMAGQPALAITWSESIGANGLLVLTLGVDTSRPDAAGVVQLTEGRLPARPGEVLVTPAGLANGLPASGGLRLRDDADRPFEVAVVGAAQVTYEGVPDLIGATTPSPDGATFLLTGDRPVTWEDAMRFADHGFQTASAHLAANPPEWARDPGLAEAGRAFLAALIAAAALLEVALVTGPAFAIGAARQRRNLALAAVNGATPAQLRRVALAQAVLLSISAALIGTVVGTAAGVGVWPLLSSDPTQLHGPLEVPVVQLVAACVLAVVAAVASALVAARGLGRLNLVATLRGSLRSAAGRRTVPRLGSVLIVGGLGLAWLVGTVVQPDASAWAFVIWCTGAVAVVSGSLLVVPALLGSLGRLGERAPVASRLALRETSRQRGRSASTVAAITAGGVVLGVIWTVMASSQAEAALEYRPDLPYGQASVTFRNWARAEQTLGRAAAIVADVDDSLLTTPTAWVQGWQPEDELDEYQTLINVNPGCDPATIFQEETPLDCTGLRGGSAGPREGILAAPADSLDRLFELSDDQSQALRAGRLLVDTSSGPLGASRYHASSTVVEDDEVSFVRYDDELAPSEVAAIEQVPALVVPPEVIERGASRHRIGALMTTDTAAARNWALGGWRLQVFSDGPISADLEARLAEALQPAGFTIEVERGWQPSVDPLVWGITGTLVLLAIVAAAMSTVLGVAELRPFLGTFAAVGADSGLSRRLASAQAWLLGLVGSVLGVAIGLAIGAPLAIASTSHLGLITPVLALPWQLAAALVIGIPPVAAGVAALSVPARPSLVRRLA